MKIMTGKEKARWSGTHDEANARGGSSGEHVSIFFEHGELPSIFSFSYNETEKSKIYRLI